MPFNKWREWSREKLNYIVSENVETGINIFSNSMIPIRQKRMAINYNGMQSQKGKYDSNNRNRHA